MATEPATSPSCTIPATASLLQYLPHDCLPRPRAGDIPATLLSDGSILFAGGHLVIDLAASAEIYDPFKGTFTRAASMPTARELHTATLLIDGRVLIAGGDDERCWIPETILSSAEIYTPAVQVLVRAPMLFSLSGDGKGDKAQSGTPRHGQIASSRQLPPLPERFCRCTPPACLKAA